MGLLSGGTINPSFRGLLKYTLVGIKRAPSQAVACYNRHLPDGKTKFWLPATLTVNQGDKVSLTLKNDIEGEPNQHGFSIPAYNITELITRGAKPKTVDFTADKAGVFIYNCQIHPPHVGGELVVLPKAP